MVTAVIAALVNLAVGLGYLSETDGQAVASLLGSTVILALGLVARQNVTPTK